MIYTKETIDYILDEHKDEVEKGIIIISERDAVDLADNEITEENLEHTSFDGGDDEYLTAGYELAGCLQERLDGKWECICRESNLEMWDTSKWKEGEFGILEANEDYFITENVTLVLSECDKDMIAYALNHTDWSEYNPEDFGGEDADVAATIHFVDIMEQLGIG